ncbi:transmembrane protein 229B-like [Leptodactylus fuscus]|uniref:transmembrane protein 229B-like n=1 Tax=Leptodactylus fuscus TaxID=238119 RepID=UPI003F4F33AE
MVAKKPQRNLSGHVSKVKLNVLDKSGVLWVGSLEHTGTFLSSLCTPLIMDSGEPLCLLYRFYIYAIHGYMCEIPFTAVFDFFASDRDWRLRGVSSVWAPFIYGVAMLGVEYMYVLLRLQCGLLVRSIVYTLWCYLCEFSSGWILRCFGACPWDYSHYKYNYKGLVTLEYAPLWFISCILLEKFLIWHTLQLRL